MKRSLVVAVLLAAALPAARAGAQAFTRPWLDWRTVRTAHFDVHYPAEMARWTLDVVSRLEAVHDSVQRLVGYAPPRVTIVVEDPAGVANGFAYSFLDEPAIVLWPTPPDPRSNIGNNRGPGEQLAIHEFTHVAHLTRPPRNPGERLRNRLLPVKIGPLPRRAPRWLTEGYATYVEGRLTGSGRPYSVIRAAVLRQWALEGRLPSYQQMSSSSGFYGGAMAYLAGSAFLEWLVDRRGEESLVHLWRRMSARQGRGFGDAFAGVYGGAPQELYGLFTVELTARALEARSMIRGAGGVVDGDTVQRLGWSTGDPAVSPDGERLAVVLRGPPGIDPRVVVWNTREQGTDSAEAAARRRLLERDPEDVPDVRWRPRTRRPIATLLPVDGRGYDAPRFLPDGRRLLVVRAEPVGGGATRPDLFVWDTEEKTVRRVTRGAAIRHADPAPDGLSAVAVQCGGGVCDLVRVDLESGAVTRLAEGSPDRVFYRPRWSPDGRTIAASLQERGRWRLVLVDAATGDQRAVPAPAEASRYDPAWLRDGRLVAVSEEGGVANLAIIDPATGESRPLTRVTGAAAAPAPDLATGDVYFLSLHAGGLDLNRVHPDSVSIRTLTPLPPSLAPAAPRAHARRDTLPRAPVPESRPYGLGPRRFRLLPQGSLDADGATLGLALANGDPIGRLAVLARGAWGGERVPRGASVSAVWRGWRPAVGAEAFAVGHQPGAGALPLDALDAWWYGGTLWLEHPWGGVPVAHRLRVGGSLGALDRDAADDREARALGFAEYRLASVKRRGNAFASTAFSLNAAVGTTGGESWRRGVATLALAAGRGALGFRGEATYGRTSAGAPAWERLTAGGAPNPLVDEAVLAQRLPMPAVRFGVVEGDELLAWRVSTRLGGLTPYLWGATNDPSSQQWYRVLGVETGIETGAQNLLRLPALRLTAGVGLLLDEPYEDEVRAYIGITYRP